MQTPWGQMVALHKHSLLLLLLLGGDTAGRARSEQTGSQAQRRLLHQLIRRRAAPLPFLCAGLRIDLEGRLDPSSWGEGFQQGWNLSSRRVTPAQAPRREGTSREDSDFPSDLEFY